MEHVTFTPFPELTSERLRLRQLQATDREDIFLLRSDDVVNQYLDRPRHKFLHESDTFITWINRGVKKGTWIYWAITWKNDQKMLGTICLWNFSADFSRADVGYEMNPAFFGQGIMDEALKKVIEYGVQTLGLAIIQAYTHQSNDASIRLLRKNHFVISKQGKDSDFVDQLVYHLKPTTISAFR